LTDNGIMTPQGADNPEFAFKAGAPILTGLLVNNIDLKSSETSSLRANELTGRELSR
jgi:hypothetical protein